MNIDEKLIKYKNEVGKYLDELVTFKNELKEDMKNLISTNNSTIENLTPVFQIRRLKNHFLS